MACALDTMLAACRLAGLAWLPGGCILGPIVKKDFHFGRLAGSLATRHHRFKTYCEDGINRAAGVV
jgi:hypothetical protein